MDNAVSYITQFSLTKSQIDFFVNKVLNEIDSGQYNPLTIHLCLKAMEELTKRIKEGISEQVWVEAEKYGKSFEYLGAKVQLSERKSYDFSNDGTWYLLNKELKEREELLRHLSNPLADPETGEMILPPRISIMKVLAITLAK